MRLVYCRPLQLALLCGAQRVECRAPPAVRAQAQWRPLHPSRLQSLRSPRLAIEVQPAGSARWMMMMMNPLDTNWTTRNFSLRRWSKARVIEWIERIKKRLLLPHAGTPHGSHTKGETRTLAPRGPNLSARLNHPDSACLGGVGYLRSANCMGLLSKEGGGMNIVRAS